MCFSKALKVMIHPLAQPPMIHLVDKVEYELHELLTKTIKGSEIDNHQLHYGDVVTIKLGAPSVRCSLLTFIILLIASSDYSKMTIFEI